MSEGRRRRALMALQVLVSACLILFVLRKINLEQLRAQELSAHSMLALLAAFGLFNLSKLAGAFRLNIYQRHAGICLSERENLQLYYAGMFLNLFLPGGIGGDGYKVLVLHQRRAAPLKTVLGITLFDRVSGLLALLILGCLCLPFLGLPWEEEHVGLLAASGAIAGVVVLLAGHCWLLKMDSWETASACGYAIGVQLLQLACMAALITGLDVPLVHYLRYMAVFLASSLAAVLPLSLGGLGAREVTFLYGLHLFGLDSVPGVIASTAFFMVTVFSSLVGVIFVRRFRVFEKPKQTRSQG